MPEYDQQEQSSGGDIYGMAVRIAMERTAIRPDQAAGAAAVSVLEKLTARPGTMVEMACL